MDDKRTDPVPVAPPPPEGDRSFLFAQRVLVAVGIATVVLLVVLLLGYAAEVFLLVFAGILLAIFLRTLSSSVAQVTRLPDPLALTLVLLGLATVLGLGGWLLAPELTRGFASLAQALPDTAERWRAYVQQQSWGQQLLTQTPEVGQLLPGIRDALTRGVGLFSTSLGFVVNVVVILFLGLFFAYEPDLYLDSVIHLVPLHYRPRARAILGQLCKTLRGWLVGRVVTMTEVALLTGLGLWLLGIPYALALAVLVGMCSFVPNIGVVLATVPILCVAWTVSPMHVFYVLALQVGIGLFDGYLFTPLVVQQAVGMPPALVISVQVLMGVLLGGLGVVLATPLVAVAVVLTRELYVRDILADRPEKRPEGYSLGKKANHG
jgi:predicted PurR-regulated permease PerM